MDLTSYLMGKKAGGGGGTGGLDWSVIGFESTPQAIVDGYNYAKSIKDNWVVKTNYGEDFQYDKNLLIFPVVDLSSATTMSEIFNGDENLIEVGDMNTSNAVGFTDAFYGCTSLTTVGMLDCSSVRYTMTTTFQNSQYLTNLKGFKDLGKAFETTWAANRIVLNLSASDKITHESLMNVINSVYDIKAKGLTNNQKIKVSSTALALLSAEEIAMADAKGWTIATS